MSWTPIIALPNIDVQCPVETTNGAIMGYNDDRVAALCAENTNLQIFLNGFKDAFDQELAPSLLLLNADAPQSFRRAHAISGLRDALCTSAVPYAIAWVLKYQQTSFEPLFGNSFAFYPWTLDRLSEGMHASTPAMLAVHDVNEFAGQANPEILYRPLQRVDEPLLAKLLERWEACFGAQEPTEEDIALFRSLNMAYHAMQTPFTTAGTDYDTGRLVALWVSAFEIIGHVGVGNVNSWEVNRVLSGNLPRATWIQMHRCATFHNWLYLRIANVRNAYLHGNPQLENLLMLPGAHYDLSKYAAILYRMLLTQFLGLHHKLVLPVDKTAPDYAEQFAKACSEHFDFRDYQNRYEQALDTLLPVANALGW
jgi:hypothetical protein